MDYDCRRFENATECVEKKKDKLLCHNCSFECSLSSPSQLTSANLHQAAMEMSGFEKSGGENASLPPAPGEM